VHKRVPREYIVFEEVRRMAKRDLRQFKNEKRLKKEDIAAAAQQANIKADLSGVDEAQIRSVEDTIKKYENKSEGEMMGDLEKMISQGRKDGTFNDNMLDAFIKNVSPMMDSTQRKKLESITRTLKRT
jgi:hypothetical protein